MYVHVCVCVCVRHMKSTHGGFLGSYFRVCCVVFLLSHMSPCFAETMHKTVP